MKLRITILSLLLLFPATSQPRDGFYRTLARSFAMGFAAGFLTDSIFINEKTSKKRTLLITAPCLFAATLLNCDLNSEELALTNNTISLFAGFLVGVFCSSELNRS